LKLFASRYREEPARPAATAYDGTALLIRVMQTHGLSAENIAQGLRSSRGIQGASGEINYNDDGERTGEIAELYKVHGGKAELIRGSP
jgi:ABC-type branched-subunit amino acid transport system substrate-binding protein